MRFIRSELRAPVARIVDYTDYRVCTSEAYYLGKALGLAIPDAEASTVSWFWC